MATGEFWLNLNNGKKELLGNLNQGVRKEQLDSNFAHLFSIFDSNKDGTLEREEITAIESWLKGISRIDSNENDISIIDNILGSEVFKGQLKLDKNAQIDLAGFAQAVAKASEDIISVDEKVQGFPPEPGYETGEREITTEYKDGTVEIINLYPNGEFKKKTTITPVAKNQVWYTFGDKDRKITPQELENNLRGIYNKQYSVKFAESSVKPESFKKFKESYIKKHNINLHTKDIKTEYSERYQNEEQAENIVKELLSELYSNTEGALSSDKFKTILSKINKDNIADVLISFEKNSPDKSLLEYITGQVLNNDNTMKEVLIGENGLFTLLMDKAKDVGMNEETIDSFKKSFQNELKNTLSGITIAPDVTKLNGILLATVNSIKLYENNPELKEIVQSDSYQETTQYEESQRKATARYTRELVTSARTLLESHLEYIKENMVKNAGEIALEDIRFYVMRLPILKEIFSGIDLLANKAGFSIEGFIKSIYTKIDELKELEADLTRLENHSVNKEYYNAEYKRLLGADYMPESMNALTALSMNPPWKNDPKYFEYRQAVNKLTQEFRSGKYNVNEFLEKFKQIPVYKPEPESKEYKQYAKQLEQLMHGIAGQDFSKNVTHYITQSGELGSALEMALFIACTMGAGTLEAGAGWLARAGSGAKVFAAYSGIRGAINFTDDALKLTGISDAVGWTDTKSFEEYLGDRQNITFGGALIGEKNAESFRKAISTVKNWAIGNISLDEAKKTFDSIDGFSFDDFVTSTGGQLTINTTTSAVFGAVMGASSTTIEKIGDFGVKLGQKLGAEVPELSNVAIGILEKNPAGMSGVDFLTEVAMKTYAKNAVGIGAKFVAETALFYCTNLGLTEIQGVLSESNTELEDAWSKGPGEFTSYLIKRFGEEAKNLLQVKSIGMIVAMLMGMNQRSVIRENYSQYETMNNVTIRLEDVSGIEGIPDGKCITLEGPNGKMYIQGSLIKFYNQKGIQITQELNNTSGTEFENMDAVSKTMMLLNTYMTYENMLKAPANPMSDISGQKLIDNQVHISEGAGVGVNAGVNAGVNGNTPALPTSSAKEAKGSDNSPHLTTPDVVKGVDAPFAPTRSAVYPCVNAPNATKDNILMTLATYTGGKVLKLPISFASDDGYAVVDGQNRTIRHIDFDGNKVIREDQYEYYKDTDKIQKSTGYEEGKLTDVTEYYYDDVPPYSVKCKVGENKVEVWIYDKEGQVKEDLLLTREEYHQRFNKELPQEKEIFSETKVSDSEPVVVKQALQKQASGLNNLSRSEIYDMKNWKEDVLTKAISLSLDAKELTIKHKNLEFNLNSLKGKELTQKLDDILSEFGVDMSSGSKAVVLEDGTCIIKDNKGKYTVEVPKNHHSGIDRRLIYNSDGNLEKVEKVTIHSDGTTAETTVEYNSDGKVKKFHEYVTNSDGSIYFADENIETNMRKVDSHEFVNGYQVRNINETNYPNWKKEYPDAINYRSTMIQNASNYSDKILYEEFLFPDGTKSIVETQADGTIIKINADGTAFIGKQAALPEVAEKRLQYDKYSKMADEQAAKAGKEKFKGEVPKGYVLDSKTKQPIKVDPNRIVMSTRDENSRWNGSTGPNHIIELKDEFGNDLGRATYRIYVTAYEGSEPKSIALSLDILESHVDGLNIGTRLIEELKQIAEKENAELIAEATYAPILGSTQKNPSNLKFYYKMGFRAIDPGIDKIVQNCIDNNLQIPVSINKDVKIKYVGAGANKEVVVNKGVNEGVNDGTILSASQTSSTKETEIAQSSTRPTNPPATKKAGAPNISKPTALPEKGQISYLDPLVETANSGKYRFETNKFPDGEIETICFNKETNRADLQFNKYPDGTVDGFTIESESGQLVCKDAQGNVVPHQIFINPYCETSIGVQKGSTVKGVGVNEGVKDIENQNSSRPGSEEVEKSDKKTSEAIKAEVKAIYDRYLYKDAEQALKNFDYEHADLHLEHLKKLIKHDSNRMSSIMENGFFSSIEGLEAMEYLIKNFGINKRPGGYISEIDVIAQTLTPKDVLNIASRGLKTKGLDLDKIVEYAQLTNAEYKRIQNSKYFGKLPYISETKEINDIFLVFDGLSYPDYMREVDQIITKMIEAEPDNKKAIIKLCKKLADDCVKGSTYAEFGNFYEYLTHKNDLAAYKKAYDYTLEKGLPDVQITLADPNKKNIYDIGTSEDIWGEKPKSNWDVIVFDKEGHFLRRSQAKISGNVVKEFVETPDGAQEYKTITYNTNNNKPIITVSRKNVFDNTGKLLYVESYELSKEVRGKYDIYRSYPDVTRHVMEETKDSKGNPTVERKVYPHSEVKYKIGMAEITPSGDIVIEKNQEHNGVATNYNYIESPDGSRLVSVNITDKNTGKTVTNNFQFKVLDENHFKSVENGVEYDIQYSNNSVTVIRSDGEETTVHIGENGVDQPGVLSRDLLPILKQMPGSFYFDIEEFDLQKIGRDINNVYEDNAHYDTSKNLIAISSKWQYALFTLIHEFGHFRDEILEICKKQHIVDSFTQERNVIVRNNPHFENKSMEYLIDAYCRSTESAEGSISEMIADVHALLYSSNMNPDLELRSQFLQEYFPKTFALIVEELQKFLPSGIETKTQQIAKKLAGSVDDTPIQASKSSPAKKSLPAQLSASQEQRLDNVVNNSFKNLFKKIILLGDPQPEVIEKRLKTIEQHNQESFIKTIGTYILKGSSPELLDFYNEVKTISFILDESSIVRGSDIDYKLNGKNIKQALALSEKIKNNDMEAMKELAALVNENENYTAELGDEVVEIDTKILMSLLSHLDHKNWAGFDAEFDKLSSDKTKSHYSSYIYGILYQHPELSSISAQLLSDNQKIIKNLKKQNATTEQLYKATEELVQKYIDDGKIQAKTTFRTFKPKEDRVEDYLAHNLAQAYRTEHPGKYGEIVSPLKEKTIQDSKDIGSGNNSDTVYSSLIPIPKAAIELFDKAIEKFGDIKIPFRLKSKYQDIFHITGEALNLRRISEYEADGLSREDMIRKMYHTEKFSQEDWNAAYKWLDNLFETREKIDKSFDRIIPALTPMTYYRGMILDSEFDSRAKNIIQNAKPGDVIIPDQGFAWASPQKKDAEGFSRYTNGNSDPETCIVMEIVTHAGDTLSRDINLDYIEDSYNPYTNMNVVFRRAAKYRVISKEVKNNKTYIKLEYIGVDKNPPSPPSGTSTTRETKAPRSEAANDKTALPDWRPLVKDLESKINKRNFIGGGSEAKVYNIDDNYVLRLRCGEKSVKGQKFTQAEDIFEGRNYGQAVAVGTNPNITICKKVPGKQLYVIAPHTDYKVDVKNYMENLKKYASLSDEALENFVENVAFINSKGWTIDHSNPENFLFDEKTGKINILDLHEKNSSSLDIFEPYGHDWILDVLINGHDIMEIYETMTPLERKEWFDIISKLEERILPMCEKHNIPKTKWNKKEQMDDSMATVLDIRSQIDFDSDLLLQCIKLRNPDKFGNAEPYTESLVKEAETEQQFRNCREHIRVLNDGPKKDEIIKLYNEKYKAFCKSKGIKYTEYSSDSNTKQTKSTVSPTGQIIESPALIKTLYDTKFADKFSGKEFEKWAEENNLTLVYKNEEGKPVKRASSANVAEFYDKTTGCQVRRITVDWDDNSIFGARRTYDDRRSYHDSEGNEIGHLLKYTDEEFPTYSYEFSKQALPQKRAILGKDGLWHDDFSPKRELLDVNPITGEPQKTKAGVGVNDVQGVNQGVNQGADMPIEPKVFKEVNDKDRIVDTYKNKSYPFYEYRGYAGGEFTPESGAVRLKKTKLPKKEQIIEVSNSYLPFGTVGTSSSLNQTLITGDLLQCAALAIVDKAHNKQSLIHVFPGHSAEDNRQIIEYFLSQSNTEDLEISIVCGDERQAPITIQYLLDTLKDLGADKNVKLFNFDAFGVDGASVVILKDGELTCCDSDNYRNNRSHITTNPKDKITYCSQDGVEVFEPKNVDKVSESNKKPSVEKDNVKTQFKPGTKEAVLSSELPEKFDIDLMAEWAEYHGFNPPQLKNGVITITDKQGRLRRQITEDRDKKGSIYDDSVIVYDGDKQTAKRKNYPNSLSKLYFAPGADGRSTKQAELRSDGLWYGLDIENYGKVLHINPITGARQGVNEVVNGGVNQGADMPIEPKTIEKSKGNITYAEEPVQPEGMTENAFWSRKDYTTYTPTESDIKKADKFLHKVAKKYKYEKANYDELVKKFDFEHAFQHYMNLKRIVKNDFFNYHQVVGPIFENGYFASKDGFDMFNYIFMNFSSKKEGNQIPEAQYLAAQLTVEQAKNIEKRGLIDKAIFEIIKLAKLTDEEFKIYKENNVTYISKSAEVNEILRSFNRLITSDKAKDVEDLVLQYLEKHPDKEYSVELLKKMLSDIDNSEYEFIKKMKNKEFLSAYEKAYKYAKENGDDNFSIIIIDPKKTMIYKVDNISGIWGDEVRESWGMLIFDLQGNFIRKTQAVNKNSNIHENITTPVGNKVYEAQTEISKKDRRLLQNSREEVRDKDGNLLYIEYYEASKDVKGKFDIYREYPNVTRYTMEETQNADGKTTVTRNSYPHSEVKYKIGVAEQSESGDIIIEKTIPHSNGSKTDYNYIESPDGSRAVYTKITDKDGNTTVEHQFQYKVIDKNHFKTIENGVEYNIEYKLNKVVVTRDDGKTVTVHIGANDILKYPALSRLFGGVLSKDLLPVLKQMPGSFYFDINKYGLNKIGRDINDVESDNAHYDHTKNLISLSKEWEKAIFTLSHEFAHYKIHALKITEKPHIVESYLGELEKLQKTAPNFVMQSMRYLIDLYCRRTEDYKGSLDEMASDIHAMMYSSNYNPEIELRSQFMQEYLPETFALIVKEFHANLPDSKITSMKEVAKAMKKEAVAKEGGNEKNNNTPLPSLPTSPEKGADVTPEEKAAFDNCFNTVCRDMKQYFDSWNFDYIEEMSKGTNGSEYVQFNMNGHWCYIRYDKDNNPATFYIQSPNDKIVKYYKIENDKIINISKDESDKIEAESTGQTYSKDAEKLFSLIKEKPTLTDLIRKMRELNIKYSLYNDGEIYFRDEQLISYRIIFDKDGNLIAYDAAWEQFVYDKDGKAQKVQKEKYDETVVNRDFFKNTQRFQRIKLELESTDDLRLYETLHKYDTNSKKPRMNKYAIEILNDLVKTEDDYKILNCLLAKKSTITRDYIYNISDIINILQSNKAKRFVLANLKNKLSFKRSDFNDLVEPGLLQNASTYKISEIKKVPDKIEDITIEAKTQGELEEKFFSNKELLRKVPSGEVVNISGKMYCNDGEKLVPINLSKSTFEKLFPASERYKMNQGTLGNCYYVNAIGAMINTPKGRAYIYSMFSEKDGDIFVTFPDGKYPIKFKDGKLNTLAPFSYSQTEHGKPRLGMGSDHINACKGIQIFEQAYSIHRYDGYEEANIENGAINDIFFMNKQMMRLWDGHSENVIEDIVGEQLYGSNGKLKRELILRYEYEEKIPKALQNPNSMIFFSTMEGTINGKYNLHDKHAYRIESYNPKTKMVGIVNPWNCNKVTQIPLYEFMNYVENLTILTLK